MALEVDVLLLEQRTGRWILRSIVLGSDREFENAKAALEATAQQTASDGRPANVILREWKKKPRLVMKCGTDAPSLAPDQVPEAASERA